MKMLSGTQVSFKIYMTSEKADQSCVINTAGFAALTSRFAKSYLKENVESWKQLLDAELGVDDFRLMTDKETIAYNLGAHKHSGDNNADSGIRH